MATRGTAINEAGIDSPEAEDVQTRYSTPVSELDDHRHQTSTRARGDTLSTMHHHRTMANSVDNAVIFETASGNKPITAILQTNSPGEPASNLRYPEQVIIDDDASATGEYVIERRGSKGLTIPRRGTLRRSHIQNRSRDSSSSRTSSVANSVDAFAGPRRRERANTAESRIASDLDTGLQRAVSAETNARRPTLSNGSIRDLQIQDDRASIRAAEEDVCFPTVDEPSKTFKIDFEELDDFAASQKKAKLGLNHHSHKTLSFSSDDKDPGVFADICSEHSPKIITRHASQLKADPERGEVSSDFIMNEKLDLETDAVLGVNDLSTSGPDLSQSSHYTFFSTELEKTVDATDFEGLIDSGESFRDLFDLPEEGGLWWLDIQSPTEDLMQTFQKAFGIHRLTTEDIITQEVREKVELFKQYYFVCFRSFFQVDESHEDYMEPVNVYMVVFREGIITITYEQSPHAANARKRMGKLRDFMSLTVDWLCYAMIDDIVDTFGPPIHKIEVEADTIEDQVFVARSDDFAELLRQIGLCRKKVMSLMRLLGGKADVIKGFAKRCNEQYSVTPRGDIGLYLGDIQDHVVTMMSNLGHFEKMLSRSHSNYLAQLSVDQIAQGNRANEVLSKITLLASILVPLNLICGLFGMNVNVPGKNVDGLGWFFGILGCIFVFSALCLFTAKRMKYI